MRVVKDIMPENSILSNLTNTTDYQDTYSFIVKNNQLSMNELYIKIFSTAPKWVDFLLSLRNKIVRLWGLKTEPEQVTQNDFTVGDKVGIFKIFKIQENEIIAGEDDKHLDFRVSVYRKIRTQTKISVSTIVKYNNDFGKFYFFIIAPFHKLIVKSLLRKSAKTINKL